MILFWYFTGLCPDWEDWDKKKGKDNATEAMGLAEQWLDVPQVKKETHQCIPTFTEHV